MKLRRTQTDTPLLIFCLISQCCLTSSAVFNVFIIFYQGKMKLVVHNGSDRQQQLSDEKKEDWQEPPTGLLVSID